MIHSIKNKFWIIPALFFLSAANAQEREIMTLNDILQRIDSSNILLKSYAYKSMAYQYSADAETAWMPPVVGLGTYMTPYPFQKTSGPEDGSVMLRLEQEIPNRKKLKAKKKYIQSLGNIEKWNRNISFNDLRTEARLLYFTWIIDLQKIKVLEDNDKLLKMMKKIEEVRFPYNQSQLSSVYRAEAEIQKNQNNILMPRGEIEKVRGILNSLMNRAGNKDFFIDTTETIEMPMQMNFDTADIAETRGDVLKINESIRSESLNIDAINLNRKPTFSIQFDHMSPLSTLMPYSFSVMGMMTIPIASWSVKSYQSQVKASQANIKAMESERAAILQQTQGMLFGMHDQIMTMQQQVNSIEDKVIPALQKAFDASFNSYQENKLSLTVVLDNWEALNMMRQELLDKKLELFKMIIEHEKELFR